MTWEIVVGFLSLATAGIAIGKVIYELSRTLTKLNCSVENLNCTLTNLTSQNRQEHEEFHDNIANLKDALHSQNMRIVKLEDIQKQDISR